MLPKTTVQHAAAYGGPKQRMVTNHNAYECVLINREDPIGKTLSRHRGDRQPLITATSVTFYTQYI